MNIKGEVYLFISENLGIDESILSEETKLFTDINWERFHPDERSDVFFEDFINNFEIYIYEHDFHVYRKNNNIKYFLIPFYYLKFIFKDREIIELESISIGDLIRFAEKKRWN